MEGRKFGLYFNAEEDMVSIYFKDSDNQWCFDRGYKYRFCKDDKNSAPLYLHGELLIKISDYVSIYKMVFVGYISKYELMEEL